MVQHASSSNSLRIEEAGVGLPGSEVYNFNEYEFETPADALSPTPAPADVLSPEDPDEDQEEHITENVNDLV